MIVGIGSDLCNIERIQKSLDRWGDKFLARCFTDIERAKAERRPFTAAGCTQFTTVPSGAVTCSGRAKPALGNIVGSTNVFAA